MTLVTALICRVYVEEERHFSCPRTAILFLNCSPKKTHSHLSGTQITLEVMASQKRMENTSVENIIYFITYAFAPFIVFS